MSVLTRLIIPCLLVTAAACGPSVSGDDDDDTPRIDAATDGPRGDGGEIELPSRVYAHSGTTLYRVDTTTQMATAIGPFTNLPAQNGMLDLAVDRNERMIGVTRTTIHEIDEANGHTTMLATYTGDAISSLSFVPVNPAEPDGEEMLIAATDTGSVIRINIPGGTATTTMIGSYGQHNGMDVVSSGDIVYVRGFGAVATVDVGTGTVDHLARLDPANGWRATVVGTGTSFDKVFGLAFWEGELYGFADNGFDAGTGAFIRINPTTGTGTLLREGPVRWFGAGVTTVAPIIP